MTGYTDKHEYTNKNGAGLSQQLTEEYLMPLNMCLTHILQKSVSA